MTTCMKISGRVKQELRGYWSLTHCQYFGRNNILQIVRSTGDGAVVAGEPARGRASTRARCETGNPRHAACRRAHASAPAPAKSHLQLGLLLGFAPSPVTFSPNRKKMKCKSSFAAGGPRSPLSNSGSGSGMRCPPCPRPRDAVPRGTGRVPQASSPGLAVPPREAEGRARPTSGSALAAGALRWRRVAGLATGFKCVTELGTAAPGASSPRPATSPGVPSARGPGDPSARPTRPRLASRLGPELLLLSPSAVRGPQPGVSPEPVAEAPPGKGERLPLHAAPSGLWDRREAARAPRLRRREEKQPPPEPCRPLPTQPRAD
ncbi:PREDICTED: LOW QUALITY PROTEIN: potassium/sodium hyperpolarization-activated cyclic nucleotide-gated channel 4-like [Galeopterus variegatus]|uniref:LOW QUALITY PROTEIN: potassium/sodium hyperpolarization-activated cyclic nucleotide-gated channel 4-like n=1 Tax=Galeopterus variegatus TaxID=482537 RepID=A0ABM0QU62_GALVR|nr:PREDICTED: LOW QUALITY PROTEIN: potassium/sodium hyperpolarization-activated cyclic nucleotide-gated channel 4-like [Galeopterus variegatus]